MKDWQNLTKPLDFEEILENVELSIKVSDLVNAIIRAELNSSGVAIKLGNKNIGTIDMIGKVVDVRP